MKAFATEIVIQMFMVSALESLLCWLTAALCQGVLKQINRGHRGW